jgi:glucosylceramidase
MVVFMKMDTTFFFPTSIFYKMRILSLLVFCLFYFGSHAQRVEKWLTNADQTSLFEKEDARIEFKKIDQTGPTIFVDEKQRFQEMDGFGFTLNGGSATLLNSLKNKNEILNELFGVHGNQIGISYLRISVGASDLSSHVFTYSGSSTPDPTHQTFSLDEERKDLLPILKEILKINPDIKIMGSPWTPPVWMKNNKNSIGGRLLPEYYASYADYFVKYIKEMAKEGVTIDAITVQNEPLHPGNNPSLLMHSDEQGDFIKKHLGPAFKKNKIKTKIIIYDHNADRPDYPISILNDKGTRKFIDGSAFHLYGGNVETIRQVREAHPDKNLYFTEQWVGYPSNFAGDFQWHTKNLIIGGGRNWCKTVLEWNVAADAYQRPHTDGGCTACLGAMTIDNQNVTRNVAYYIIAHASKFVRPGSHRISSNTTMSLQNVAFKTKNGRKVLIVLNESHKEESFSVSYSGRTFTDKLKAGSVATYYW